MFNKTLIKDALYNLSIKNEISTNNMKGIVLESVAATMESRFNANGYRSRHVNGDGR